MRVTVIHNPKAGDESQPTAGQVAALVEEAGHKVRLQAAGDKGWSKVLKKKADLVAVAGGDGTVGKVARRLVGRGIPIAVLPMGTANNISRTLGIAGRPVHQLIREWKNGKRIEFDAGVATGPWGTRNFIEGIGAGLFAWTMPEVDRSRTMANLTTAEVKVAYALQMLRDRLETLKPMRINAVLDATDISGDYLLFEAMNTRYIGPNLFLAPHVAHSAGMLDLVFLARKDRAKLAKYLAAWQDGRPHPPEFGVGRGKRLVIEWTGFPMHIDDKMWPKKGKPKPRPPQTIEIELHRAALEFLVPEQAALAATGEEKEKAERKRKEERAA